MNDRKDGFYFIIFDGERQPAEWKSAKGVWRLIGYDMDIYERNVDKIYETPLIPPEN